MRNGVWLRLKAGLWVAALAAGPALAIDPPAVPAAVPDLAAVPTGEAPPAAPAAPAPRLITLKRDTPVDLIATREISTANLQSGALFTLAVNQPVKVDAEPVIPFMAEATGELTLARKAGGMGRNGSMSARLMYIQLGDLRIPIQGEMSSNGGGAGSAQVAVLFAGVVGLFHRGNNAKIKAGEHVPAFIAEDVVLDMSSKPPRRVEMKLVPVAEPVPAPAAAPEVPKP